MRYVKRLAETRMRGPNDSGWQDRHQLAVTGVGVVAPPPGLVAMSDGITDYVREMLAGTEGESDAVLAEYVGQMLMGWIGLLNGPIGALDAGTCWQWAADVADAVGFCLDHDSMAFRCSSQHRD